MIRVILSLWLVTSLCFANDTPPGFLWYNVPKPPIPAKQKSKGVPFNKLSYTDRDAVLRFYTLEALHAARNTHDVKDMARFLTLQDYWLKESSTFKTVFEKTLMMSPGFDYSVTHPTSQAAIQLQDNLKAEKTDLLLEKTATQYGLLFFYRGKNSFDVKEAPIVKSFSEKHHFTLLPVSVDGQKSDLFQQSKIDSGQAERLGVRFFPAILLVNPKTKQTIPVAYGFTTQDVLTTHLINVITGYKGVEL